MFASSIKFRIFPLSLLSLMLLFLTVACAATPTPSPTPEEEMGGMNMSEGPTVPAGMAYLDGQDISFIHTEVSDAKIAEVLTAMMNSPVLVVPTLVDAPDSMLANVYVFTNGIAGMGPLGFQPDVFDNPPGTDGYRPLRRLITVTWQNQTSARELKSVAEIEAAETAGEVTLAEPGVVINMPFVSWPGGQR